MLENSDPEQDSKKYNFDLVTGLQEQGFTSTGIALFLARLSLNDTKTEDRDPNFERTQSWLLSNRDNNLLGTQNEDFFTLNTKKLKGISIFNWDDDFRANNDLNKTLWADLSIYSVSRQKLYNKSSVVGSEGTIKEYISDDDIQITIDLTFYNDGPDVRPAQQVRRFLEMVSHVGKIEILNDFLNNEVGIFDIVIEGYTMTQSTVGNLQSATITAVSDLPEPQF